MSSGAPIKKTGKKKSEYYCVLESIDGARIVTLDNGKSALEYLKGIEGSLVHFAGTLAGAEELQKSIEQRNNSTSGE